LTDIISFWPASRQGGIGYEELRFAAKICRINSRKRGNGKALPSDNSAGIPSRESQLEEDVEWGKARVNGVEIGWNLSEQYVAQS